MAITATSSTPPLSPAEVAQIPSPSLPIGPQISHLLSEFTTLSIQLFTILSTTSPSASAGSKASTAEIYESLGAVDEKLARLLVMYADHQRRQQRVEALISTLRTLDSTWHESASTLHSCVSSLDPIVASGALDRTAISNAQAASLTPSQILSYARLLAPFTSAPPSSLFPPEVKLKGVGATDPTGRSLPMGAIPPFPTEAAMRRGRLQFGREGLMQGLGATEEVGGALLCSSDLTARSLTSVVGRSTTRWTSSTRRNCRAESRRRRPPRARGEGAPGRGGGRNGRRSATLRLGRRDGRRGVRV